MKPIKLIVIKKIILLLNLILTNFYGFTQNVEWAQSIGGLGSDNCYSNYLDDSGNIYNIGTFEGTVDFDPGPGIFYMKSVGRSDAFITKSESSGKLIWAKQISGDGFLYSTELNVDHEANIYITGTFTKTVDFDPGTDTNKISSIGEYDIFILKLDRSGIFGWVKTLGNDGSSIQSFSIVIDINLNIYITGSYTNKADFDSDTSEYYLNAVGLKDIFVLKLNNSGKFVWAKSMGEKGHDIGYALAIDPFENIIVAGAFQGGFIQKLDTNGNFIWGKGIAQSSAIISIALDYLGNIFATAGFQGTVDFDPGLGTYYLSSSGMGDVYILKLSMTGNLLWAKSIGGPSWDASNDLALDKLGNVYVIGNYNQTSDFDPGIGTYKLTSNEMSSDIFILKLDSLGRLKWVKSIGGKGSDMGNSITINNSKSIYVTGAFSDKLYYNSDTGTYYLNSSGGDDIFVLKIDTCLIPIYNNKISGLTTVCEGISATYSIDSIGGAKGYRWYVPVGATINSGQNTNSVTIKFGSTSGKVKVTPVFLCGYGTSDSIMVSVKGPKADFIVTDTICDGDSVVFTNLSKGGISYKWNFDDGQFSYKESPRHLYEIGGTSRIYNVNLVATIAKGCSDSTSKTVTVNTNPNSDFTFNTSGRLVYFYPKQPGNINYHWQFGLDEGSSNTAITKYHYLNYTIGEYKTCLHVTNLAGCISETCKIVNITGEVEKITNATGLGIYPNPNKGDFQIILENPIEGEIILIFNTLGQTVETIPIHPSQKNYFVDLNISNGIYFIKLLNGNKSYVSPVLITD